MTLRSLLTACLLVGALASSAHAVADPGVDVSPEGATRLAGGSAGEVVATLTTRYADPREAALTGATRCSGGRTSCSLVDRLVLTVDGRNIDVPGRAVLLLSDVNRAQLSQISRGRFELRLACSDAGAAYEARLFFDRSRVDRLVIWSAEAGVTEQVTSFQDLSHAFR